MVILGGGVFLMSEVRQQGYESCQIAQRRGPGEHCWIGKKVRDAGLMHEGAGRRVVGCLSRQGLRVMIV